MQVEVEVKIEVEMQRATRVPTQANTEVSSKDVEKERAVSTILCNCRTGL